MPDLNRSLLSEGENADTLTGLTDVNIATPEKFQVLVHDGSQWQNEYPTTVSLVHNAEANTLAVGEVVYLFGGTGNHASVKRADNDSDDTSAKTVGLVAESILSGEAGPVVTRGYVRGIDLSTGYTNGDTLYLGENGGFTNVKPSAPEHLVYVGVVVSATNNGIIYVATQNGYELEELHNVAIANVASGDFLKYNGSLWINDAINLGTDTVGDYVGSVAAGTGVNVSNTATEGGTFTVGLANTAVTAATYGSANTVATFTVDAQGRLTNAANTTISIASSAVTDFTEAAQDAAGGLISNGSQSGISVTYDDANAKINFDVNDFVITLGGDLTGSTTITNLANATLTATIAANSVSLGTDTTGNYVSDVTAGAGISVSHTPGEGSSANISLNANIAALSDVASTAPSAGDVLTWSGSEWVPDKNYPSLTTTSITSNSETTIASFDKSLTNSAEFNVQISQGDGYLANKILVLHNGTNVTHTKYGQIAFARSESVTEPDTWTTQVSNFGNLGIQDVAYGNNLWVAGGESGELRTSTDAVTWTTRTSNFGSTGISSFAYGNNVWVAVGASGQIRSSTDAITWVTRTSGFFSFAIINTVAYGNDKFAIAGNLGRLYTSTDAITWTERTSGFGTSNIADVFYGNNLWVAVGDSGQLRTSTDAISWVTQTSNFGTTSINSVFYGGGLWLAGGSGGQIRTSTDGITWVTQTSNLSGNIYAVTYGGGNFIIGDWTGQIRTSTDTITWVTRTSNTTNWIKDIEFGDGLFVAVADFGQMRTAEAGIIPGGDISVTFSADIFGSDVRLRAAVTDADAYNATAKVLKTLVEG